MFHCRLKEDLNDDQKKARQLEVDISVSHQHHQNYNTTKTTTPPKLVSPTPKFYQHHNFTTQNPQNVVEKIETHKGVIDANNKSFYEMKKQKDAKQNERKYVLGCEV